MKRVQQKDKAAFEMLYQHYHEAIRGVIYRIVVSKEETEDLVQDVFIKLWKNSHSYNPAKGTFFTWLANVARNTCIDHLRSASHTPQITVIEHDYQYNEILAAMLQPADNISLGELHKLVQQLPPTQRQVIEMVYFRGFTQYETAEILSLALGTVKTRCRVGLQQLKELGKNRDT